MIGPWCCWAAGEHRADHNLKTGVAQGAGSPLLNLNELGFQAFDLRDAHRLFQLVNFR